MGAINYGSNEQFNINLGVNTNVYNEEFIQEILFNDAQKIIDNYNLYYFDMVIKYGHYDGFYIVCENEPSYHILDKQDQEEAAKECVELKKLYIELIESGLVCYNPGWCMGGYYNETESTEIVKKVIYELQENIIDMDIEE